MRKRSLFCLGGEKIWERQANGRKFLKFELNSEM